MLTLLWTILATLAGGLLSLLAAALLAYTLLERWASRMGSRVFARPGAGHRHRACRDCS